MKTQYALVVSLSLVACGAANPDVAHPSLAAASQNAIDDFTEGDRMGVHGMVVFGDESRQFMSHIPMMHKPHDVQVVFEVSFDAQDVDFSSLVTFVPTRFSLDSAIVGAVRTLQGTLYAGNFEDNGTPIKDVEVEIKALATTPHQLSDSQVADKKLSYWVVGEKFLVHPISHASDFDQILALDTALSDGDVQTTRSNRISRRLKGGDAAGDATVVSELSLLRGPDFVP